MKRKFELIGKKEEEKGSEKKHKPSQGGIPEWIPSSQMHAGGQGRILSNGASVSGGMLFGFSGSTFPPKTHSKEFLQSFMMNGNNLS